MKVGTQQQSHLGNVASGSDKNGERPGRRPSIRSVRVTVTGFDHVVLRVRDVERSLAFYLVELGLAPVRVDAWRAGRAPFPSVRVSDDVIIDLLAAPEDHAGSGNVDHICLVVAPVDWHAVIAAGRFEVVDGPDTRYGARGNGQSLYIRDPDQNVVELRYYPTHMRADGSES